MKRPRGSEMIQTFCALGIQRELLATLAVLQQSCDKAETQAEVIAGHIRMLAAAVGEMQRRPPKRA